MQVRSADYNSPLSLYFLFHFHGTHLKDKMKPTLSSLLQISAGEERTKPKSQATKTGGTRTFHWNTE